MEGQVPAVSRIPDAFAGWTGKFRLSGWLRELRLSGELPEAEYKEVLRAFSLTPDLPAWRVFLERVAALVGTLFFVAGCIMFVAWNWEDLPRWGKFSLAQAVFASLVAVGLARWKRPGGQAALLGAGLCVGALMALYGQCYQTGANAWELFRAWTLVLLPLALVGRRAGFWFLAWLVGNLWFLLYQSQVFSGDFLLDTLFTLECALLQIGCWILFELAHQFGEGFHYPFDPSRRLIRTVGGLALALVSASVVCVVLDLRPPETGLLFNYGPRAFGLLYAALLAGIGVVYYRLRPDMFFVGIGVFSLITVLITAILRALFSGHHDEYISTLFVAALIVIGLCIGGAKVIFALRKDLKTRLELQETAAGDPESSRLRERRGTRESLIRWLESRAALAPEKIHAFFQREEDEQDKAQPWYMKVPLILGIWLGASLLVGVIVIAADAMAAMLPLGLAFCAAGAFVSGDSSFVLRQLALCAIVCGLGMVGVYSLETAHWSRTALHYALIFAALWLFMPRFTAKAVSFAAMCEALFLYLRGDVTARVLRSAASSSMAVPTSSWFELVLTPVNCLTVTLLVLCLLRLGRDPLTTRPGLKVYAHVQSTAWGAALFLLLGRFMGVEWAAGALFGVPLGHPFGFGAGVAVAAGCLLATVAFAWMLQHDANVPSRSDAGRSDASSPLSPLLVGGALISLLSWFAPSVALGLLLLLLARRRNDLFLSSAAGVYLAVALIFFYYNLGMSFLHKSFLLMGSGLLLALAGYGLSRRGGFLKQGDRGSPTPGVKASFGKPLPARLLCLLLLVGFLGAYNLSIFGKERLIATGQPIVLRLAPLDPRSLMQGDYMDLEFQTAQAITEALTTKYSSTKQAWPSAGVAVLREEKGEHLFARLHEGETPAPGEILLAFKTRGKAGNRSRWRSRRDVNISGNSWFFEEGLGKLYEQARYAELRADADGTALIVALLDADKRRLKKGD